MLFRKRKGFYNHFNYKTKILKRKWFGFYGYYLAQGDIYWTGNSYFVKIDITDLNWRDYKEDKHWYEYKRHFKNIWEAKKWCEMLLKFPPNYSDNIWGNRILNKKEVIKDA